MICDHSHSENKIYYNLGIEILKISFRELSFSYCIVSNQYQIDIESYLIAFLS